MNYMLSGDKDEAIRRIESITGLSIDEAIEILKPMVDVDAAIRQAQCREVYQFWREAFGYGEDKEAFSIPLFVEGKKERRMKALSFMNEEEIGVMIDGVEKRKNSLLSQIESLEARLNNLRGLQRNLWLDFEAQAKQA